jgi:hypothetical protein
MAEKGTPGFFERLGMGLTDWLKMKGKATPGGEETSWDDAPAEYRDLVRQYFKELANQGMKEEKEK